jgi:6-phosphogluconate dehydrogenase
MGQNLVMNMNDHGFTVAVFNRTTEKVDEFLAGSAKGSKVVGTHSVKELCSTLKSPRRVMLMIQAGKAVDAVIDELVPFLEKGDIISDGSRASAKKACSLSAAGSPEARRVPAMDPR